MLPHKIVDRLTFGQQVVTMQRRIDIIGAGVSGLSTAYYLAKKLSQHAGTHATPVTIHVWEKDAVPGGLAGTFAWPGVGVIEKFYHHFYRRDAAIQELIADVGLTDDLVWRPAATGAYYARRPYRLSSPLDLLRFNQLPLPDRIRLGWLVLHAQMVRDWRTLDDRSAKEYIVRVAGANAYRVVWEPLFHGKFGVYADSVSAAWLWSKLVDRGGSRNRQGHELLGYLRGGLGRLFERMIACVQQAGHHVHLGQAIQRLESDGARLTTIVTTDGAIPADIVVSCAQTPDLVKLLSQQAGDYRTRLGQIEFLANVCLVLTLKQSLSDFYWTNVTDPAAPIVGIIEQTKWADAADYNQKHVVYLSAYVTPDDPRLTMSPDTLVQQYLPWITQQFPAFTPDLIEQHALWTAPYAQPIVKVGYRHLVPEITTPLANLFVCTMAQIYPHDRQVSNGVAMARKTAGQILNRLGDL